jgi:hypothetical protein
MRLLALTTVWLVIALPAAAQVRVHPTGVNVNTQGATTVFLTFGSVAGHVAAEALWCGALVPAAPDLGAKCDPSTIFGSLPQRLDQSRVSGTGGFTDIMSIPASVTRRAYDAAARGETSSFFYVRRFQSTTGGPDEYVAVTCRLAGGGARVPFSLVDVQLRFATTSPIVHVRPGDATPPVSVQIAYTGTGRLRGRWEVVLPGDEPPTVEDLLPEAALPLERRGGRTRYTEVARFNHFLPPTGRATVPGPDPARLPVGADGIYLLLFRVEAAEDKESDSNLAAAGAGSGVVTAGAVAGFPMPVLRYVVGSAATDDSGSAGLTVVRPSAGSVIAAGDALDIAWVDPASAAMYRIEIATDGRLLLDALIPSGVWTYRAPPWLKDRATAGTLRWRIVALSPEGRRLRATSWREARFEK